MCPFAFPFISMAVTWLEQRGVARGGNGGTDSWVFPFLFHSIIYFRVTKNDGAGHIDQYLNVSSNIDTFGPLDFFVRSFRI